MIRSLGVGEESNEYRPAVLCPNFLSEDIMNNTWEIRVNAPDTKDKNLEAVEQYTVALCKKLANKLQQQYDNMRADQNKQEDLAAKSSVFNDHIRLNLEKIAAKSFNPTFTQTRPKTFASFMEQTKLRMIKYSDVEANKNVDAFVTSREIRRDPIQAQQKQDQSQYKDRIKARLSVYHGWEFKENFDRSDSFTLVNFSSIQEITVIKKPNGSFTIKSTGSGPITDETIAIMLELSHNVLRFSDSKMKMTIKGIDQHHELGNKVEEGLKIINQTKPVHERLNYRFDNKQDPK